MRSKKKYYREMKEKNYLYHVVAICVSAVWGITFISTKTLINYGLTPTEIFTLRFAIAYVGMWFIAPRPLFCRSDPIDFRDVPRCGFASLRRHEEQSFFLSSYASTKIDAGGTASFFVFYSV